MADELQFERAIPQQQKTADLALLQVCLRLIKLKTLALCLNNDISCLCFLKLNLDALKLVLQRFLLHMWQVTTGFIKDMVRLMPQRPTISRASYRRIIQSPLMHHQSDVPQQTKRQHEQSVSGAAIIMHTSSAAAAAMASSLCIRSLQSLPVTSH